MNKTELESKHLSELHALAAEAAIPRYRMLRREELVEKLLDGKPAREKRSEPKGERERPAAERAERAGRERSTKEEKKEEPRPVAKEEPRREPAEQGRPERRPRRRRRFGRRGKGLRAQALLLPPPGRQALLYGEDRAACTALLRELAAELVGASKGPDPIALLIDPGPEELAEWKREVPDAELVAASRARHALDALAQAVRRAEGGEDVILLVDSLSKLEDADAAKQIFDGGLSLASAQGSLTVVAALERPA